MSEEAESRQQTTQATEQPAATARLDGDVPVHVGVSPPKGQEREWIPRTRYNEVAQQLADMRSEYDTVQTRFGDLQQQHGTLQNKYERETVLLGMADKYPVLRDERARRKVFREFTDYRSEVGDKAAPLAEFVPTLADDPVWGPHFQVSTEAEQQANAATATTQAAETQRTATGTAAAVNAATTTETGTAQRSYTPTEIRTELEAGGARKKAMLEYLNSKRATF